MRERMDRSTIDGTHYGYGPPGIWEGFDRGPVERGVWCSDSEDRAREAVVRAARRHKNATGAQRTQAAYDLWRAVDALDAESATNPGPKSKQSAHAEHCASLLNMDWDCNCGGAS